MRKNMIVTLKDITTKITKGTTPTSIGCKFEKSGINFIKSESLVDGKTIDKSKFAFISERTHERLKRSQIEKNDILFSMAGMFLGKTGIATAEVVPANTNQAVAIIRVDDTKANYEYVYYYLNQKSVIHTINTTSAQSAQPNINLKQIGEIKINLPDRKKQDQIVSLLSAIDLKISNNVEINDNLEQQAAALFSSLYNRSNTEVRYTDLIQILGGGTPKTGETAYWNGNIAFFTPKDVGAPYTFITEKTITEEGLSHCNSRLYPVNTVFVTARGTVGKVGLSGVPMAMNQSCYALVGKETHQLLVYFYTLKAVDRLKHKASGAVFDAITTRDFDSEQIMKLSDDDAKAFLCVAEPMFQEILNNSIENLRLSTLRDFLLPKLMSGEIDVSSVQI
ncbi:restriction endonuclease subunit S [Faecalibacterium prausnitzii]|uniref:Restriction endonuclease subunit S n=2 Tax=Faecalibacterium prausnitzii TaxID=853 RepID=A0A3E2V2X0_9FIRM|nr:restriction endonuclease subunit S [Faecalibacterium prausnitzii]RGC33851.1 restriction endonuclease subunit S [Faecalibacterium prausnitzii]